MSDGKEVKETSRLLYTEEMFFCRCSPGKEEQFSGQNKMRKLQWTYVLQETWCRTCLPCSNFQLSYAVEDQTVSIRRHRPFCRIPTARRQQIQSYILQSQPSSWIREFYSSGEMQAAYHENIERRHCLRVGNIKVISSSNHESR